MTITPTSQSRPDGGRGRRIQWTPTPADEPGFFFPIGSAESREPSRGSEAAAAMDRHCGSVDEGVRNQLPQDEGVAGDGYSTRRSIDHPPPSSDNIEEIADSALEKTMGLLRRLEESLDVGEYDVHKLRCRPISSVASDATFTTCPETRTMLSESSACRSEPALSSLGDSASCEDEIPFHSGMQRLVATLELRVAELEERIDILTSNDSLSPVSHVHRMRMGSDGLR